MAKPEYALGLKLSVRKDVRVRLPLPAPNFDYKDKMAKLILPLLNVEDINSLSVEVINTARKLLRYYLIELDFNYAQLRKIEHKLVTKQEFDNLVKQFQLKHESDEPCHHNRREAYFPISSFTSVDESENDYQSRCIDCGEVFFKNDPDGEPTIEI
jgi:hypothetical protein